MYALNTTFPTHLFFYYNNFNITSASGLKTAIDNICISETFESEFKKNLLDLKGFSIIEFFVKHYPYIVFTENKFEEKDINTKNCTKEIIQILNKKIDLQQLRQITSNLLNENKVENFNENIFYSNLYIFIYKIFFVEISKNINFFYVDDFKSRTPLKLEEAIIQYTKYEKDLLDTKVTSKDYDSKKNYVINSRKSLKPTSNIDIYDKFIDLYKYTQHKDKNLILYNLITTSIRFKEGTTATYKNKIYRCLFKIIAEYYFPFDNAFKISSYSNDDKYYISWFKKLK